MMMMMDDDDDDGDGDDDDACQRNLPRNILDKSHKHPTTLPEAKEPKWAQRPTHAHGVHIADDAES